MGVLSALPFVAAGNLCCCLWVVSGGLVAAYLLQHNQAAPITPGDGAAVGLIAGLIGALVQFVVAVPVGILVAPMEQLMLGRLTDVAGNMPPDMRDALERYASQSRHLGIAGMIALRVVGLVFALFVGSIFSTLGGLLGAVIFRKHPQQQSA
jgi:hypothetical protein